MSAIAAPHCFQTVRRPFLLRVWPWLAAALTGLLLILSFPPWNQGWLCWVALTPLISAVFASPSGSWRRGLRIAGLGYVAGFVFIAGTFYWLGTTLAPLFGNSLLLCLPILLALYMGLYLAIWSWFVGALLAPNKESAPRANSSESSDASDSSHAQRFQSSVQNLLIGCAGAAAWISLEYSRTWLLGGFGWNPLGVALHQDLAMIQIADITGVPGLSFLVAFTNLMAVIIVRRIISEIGPVFLTRIRWEFSVTMALIAFVFAYGVRVLLHKDSSPSISLRTVAIQPNILQPEKMDLSKEEEIFHQLDRLTGLAALSQPRPQLFIWPEAATIRSMFADRVNYEFVMDQAAQAGAPLLLGSTDFDLDRREDYNIAALLTERGAKQQFYRKIHLVPFGEYLPLRPISAIIGGQLVPSDFTPGKEYTVFKLADPSIRFATLICFEDTLGEVTRHFVANGAQLLVNITNDGWFARSPAAEQHVANALFRAIEMRRPLIRCTNTGITCSVDIHGVVDRWINPFEQGFAVRDLSVPTATATTFYTRHGDWVTYLSFVITFLSAAGSLRRNRARKMTKPE